jgi:2-isopropylmalate synthase
MYTQAVDPKLDFSNIRKIREIYEKVTKMPVHKRHPYAGDLVFTAFSGSHQDAINKGMAYMRESGTEYWSVPYLPIDPADVGREYEPIIRINSQSGKGGAAYVMQTEFGYNLPKAMHPDFGAIVKAECDKLGTELKPQDVFDIFKDEYIGVCEPYNLKGYSFTHRREKTGTVVTFRGVIRYDGTDNKIAAAGNGPIDAFFKAIKGIGLDDYHFVSYNEQAISDGSDSMALSYIELKAPDGRHVFGVDTDSDISVASIKAVMSAINRSLRNS